MNDSFIPVMFCLMLVIIFLIFKMYNSDVNSKNIVVLTYLYIIVGLAFIAMVTQYTKNMSITDREHIFQMVIMYFVLAFGGISLMISDKFFVNHIGYLLLLLALSLILGSSFRYANNVPQAASITAIIVGVLTVVVFSTSEENLVRMKEWLPSLTSALFCVILIQLGYLMLFNYNETFVKIMMGTIIALFCLFVLSDTSRLIIDAQETKCMVHSCLNYPLRASGMVLNYVNIFVNLLNGNN